MSVTVPRYTKFHVGDEIYRHRPFHKGLLHCNGSSVSFLERKTQLGLRPPHVRSLDHKQVSHIPGTTALNEWSARHRGRYLQKTQQTNIHNNEFCVLHVESNTTIFYLLVQ